MNILVLGMHRSGTSAMAQVLREAGFFCGEDDGFLEPRADNPNGFVERREFVQFNDALLASQGWTWDAPAPGPRGWLPGPTAMIDDGRELIDRLLGGGRPWVLKDPRMSILMPWWRQILLDRFVSIVMVRPPEEVAWSLWVRDRLPLALGRALWGTYYRHLAADLDGLPVIVVSYPALTERPGEVIPAVMEALDRMGVELPAQTGAPVSRIDPFLRRATQPTEAFDQPADDSLGRLADAWSMGTMAALDRFELRVPVASSWEVGILEVQRRYREQQAVALAAEVRAQAIEARQVTAPPSPDDQRLEDTRPVPARRQLLLRARLRMGLPNPLFNAVWYLSTYRDVRGGPLGAWLHWRRQGWREGRDPEPLFDTQWYLASNPDVRLSGMDPLAHFLLHGSREGRDPGPDFDVRAYRERYPDVSQSGVDPLLHYRRFGANEGRSISPRNGSEGLS